MPEIVASLDKRVFALIRRSPGVSGHAAFEVEGVYLDEKEAHAKAKELNDAMAAAETDDDHFFYYQRTSLND
jgi:hypothetical protein